MSALISRDLERAVARRAIAPTDVYRWPALSFDGAGSLETGRVFIGLTVDDTRPLKPKHFVFTDSSNRDCSCYSFAVSHDGKLLAASFWSTVLVWRLSDGLLVQRLLEQGHTDEINSVAFSPDNLHLVSASDDYTAIVWNVRGGRALLRLVGHVNQMRSAAYSPDGSRIATGSDDRSVKIWDASSGTCLHSLDLGERVCEVTFTPDGARLAVRLVDRGAICDVQSGTRIAVLEHEGGRDMYLPLSQRGDRVLTGTDSGKAKVWSAVTGEELLELSGHTEEIQSVAFSPDGAEVATASTDRTVVTCDSWTGQRRHVYQMSSSADSVTYSPDGSYLAMGDRGGRVRVHHAKSGAFVAEFEGHTERVYGLRFLPDGHSLLSHSWDDGTVRLWSIRDAMRLR